MSIDGHKALVSHGWARSRWRSVWVVGGLAGLVLAPLGVAAPLPPPPSNMEAVADAQLFLELVVNQMDTGRVVAVDQRAGGLFVPAATLRDVGMNYQSRVTVRVSV